MRALGTRVPLCWYFPRHPSHPLLTPLFGHLDPLDIYIYIQNDERPIRAPGFGFSAYKRFEGEWGSKRWITNFL